MKGVLLFFTALLSAGPAMAAPGAPCPRDGEAACMVETIWAAAEVLPAEKRARLVQPVLHLVKTASDKKLLSTWETRLGEPISPAPRSYEYAGEQATFLLTDEGWDGFMQRARDRQAPFNIGRPEIMAAGVRQADTPKRARDLMDLMFTLARPNVSRGGGGDNFEQADFGHVLSELAMERCDLAAFDKAAAMTAQPDALRYTMWRARITGESDGLAPRILQQADADDTRHVRQAIEGYRAISTRGYCKRAEAPVQKDIFSERFMPIAR